ncbi:MAG: hypothetical protein Q8R39_00025 [bacterium]|nr:hypothetical protein [bacterium]MDZ4284771.1 hypothetical protein [Patescibacteria group bacterium]
MHRALGTIGMVWLAYISISLAAVWIAVAEAAPHLFAAGDLYYFNAQGAKTPLALAPKVIVRLHKDIGRQDTQEKTLKARLSVVQAFSDEFSGIGISVMDNSPVGTVYLLEFLPNTSTEHILTVVRAIAGNTGVEVAPVFIVEHREALIGGVILTPRLALEASFIEEEFKRLFEGALLRQIAQKEKTFSVYFQELFFFAGSRMPLSLLGLANMAHAMSLDLPWLEKASLEFVFLSNPVVVSMYVEPLTGTIGEVRTLSLSVTVYNDPDIVLDESIFPRFGEGTFAPMFSGNVIPPDAFFRVVGEKERIPYSDSRRTTITHRWRFMLYVPAKEWVLQQRTIVYKKGGVSEEVRVQPVTFITLAHTLSGITILDIPAPLPLEAPEFSIATVPEPTVPRYWFGERMPRPLSVGYAGLIAGTVCVLSVVLLWARAAFPRKQTLPDETRRASYAERIRHLKKDADFYSGLEEVLAAALRAVLPALPRRFSFAATRELMENDVEAEALFTYPALLREAEVLRTRLERRFAPDFAFVAEDMDACAESALRVLELLQHAPSALRPAQHIPG